MDSVFKKTHWDYIKDKLPPEGVVSLEEAFALLDKNGHARRSAIDDTCLIYTGILVGANMAGYSMPVYAFNKELLKDLFKIPNLPDLSFFNNKTFSKPFIIPKAPEYSDISMALFDVADILPFSGNYAKWVYVFYSEKCIDFIYVNKDDELIGTTGIDRNIAITQQELDNENSVIKKTLSCLIYLMSGSPDLRVCLPVERKYKGSNVKKLRRQDQYTDCNVIQVGYGWLKERQRLVGECSVSGHFRWQPYGEGRTKVKLIWINQYTKVFKKE